MSENHICGLNVFYNDNLFCSFCLTEIRDRERQKTLDDVEELFKKKIFECDSDYKEELCRTCCDEFKEELLKLRVKEMSK